MRLYAWPAPQPRPVPARPDEPPAVASDHRKRPDVVSRSGALHAWTTGAIGVMSLAVMTRATRGHTSRPIVSTPETTIIYCAIIVSAVARITASLLEGEYWDLLVSAAVAWIMAFAGFVVVYGPMLCRKRYPDSPA